MTEKELKGAIEELRKSGYSDKQIAASFIGMYLDKKLNIEQLAVMLGFLKMGIPDMVMKLSDKEQRYVMNDIKNRYMKK